MLKMKIKLLLNLTKFLMRKAVSYVAILVDYKIVCGPAYWAVSAQTQLMSLNIAHASIYVLKLLVSLTYPRAI